MSYPQAPYGTQSQSIQELHTIDEILDQGEREVASRVEYDRLKHNPNNVSSASPSSPAENKNPMVTQAGSNRRPNEEFKIGEQVINTKDPKQEEAETSSLNAPINTINCRSPPSMSSPIHHIREGSNIQDSQGNTIQNAHRRYVIPLVSRVSIDNF